MSQLRSLGITGKYREWVHDFLKGKSGIVVVSDDHSEEKLAIRGVRQGTIRTPMLYVVTLSDMPSMVQSANLTVLLTTHKYLMKL